MRRTAAAAFLVVAVATAPAWAVRLPLRSYGPAEGLVDAGVNRVAVGPSGFVWIATRGGLWRFDGERFDVLGPEDGVPRREIFDFAFAGDGTLWIASEAGLFHGDPAKVAAGRPSFAEVPLGDGGRRERPHRVATAHDGSLWVGTFEGLWRVTGSGAAFRGERRALPWSPALPAGSRVQSLAVGPDGSVWVGSHADGVFRVRPDGRVDHAGHLTLGCDFVRAFLFDDAGGVWTAFFGGVARFDAVRFGASGRAEAVLSPADGLPGIDTENLLALEPGRLLLASTAGITEIDRDRSGGWRVGATIDRRWGLPDDNVASLDRDAAGNLWIGFAQRGLAKRIAGGFLEQDDAEGPGTRIAALGHDREGRLAVLSQSGAYGWTIRVAGAHGAESHTLALPRPFVYVGWGMQQLLAQEKDGTWWVVSGSGLLRYGGSPDGARRLERPPDTIVGRGSGLPGNDVYVLFLDSAGDLWSSSQAPGNRRSTVSRIRRGRTTVEAFAAPEIGSDRLAVGFAEDRGHDVWIAFEDGTLIRRHAGRFEPVPCPLGPLSAAPLVADGRGRLWIVGDGLAVVDRPEDERPAARRYRLPPALEGVSFNSGADDGTGTLYLGTSRGVVRLEPESGRTRLFTAADGLVGGVIRLAARDASGTLWFSDESGLSRFSPGPDPPAAAHEPRIREVRVSGVPVPVPAVGIGSVGPLTVGPSQRTVEVGWFAVHHGPGEPPRFQHRLEGTDAGWSAPSGERSVLYAGLAPGRYRFEVRAVEADGAGSTDPAIVEFRVLAPLWRRGWFVGLLAAASAALVYAAHRARVARAVAIERVRTRIATDLHDEIGSSLSQISVLSQVAEREAARAAGTAPRSLSRIAELARGAVEAMGETVWAISPREDRLSDLVHRMRRFGLDLFADGGAEIRLDLPPGEPDEPVDPEVRRTVYLVFKEALHNARKHASARTVHVTLRRESGGFELTVTDDGAGFDPARSASGHGMENMRRRAEALGGRLEVTAAPGAPTTIVLRVSARHTNLFRRIVGRHGPTG